MKHKQTCRSVEPPTLPTQSRTHACDRSIEAPTARLDNINGKLWKGNREQDLLSCRYLTDKMRLSRPEGARKAERSTLAVSP
jgi:hypothetical protein